MAAVRVAVTPVRAVPIPSPPWPREAGGRKAFSFLTGEGVPRDITELRMPRSITSLPEWVVECTELQRLSLHDCRGLTALPDTIGQLSALQEINLEGCNGLASMPDLSGLPGLKVNGLPYHLQPWEAGGRKAWKKE